MRTRVWPRPTVRMTFSRGSKDRVGASDLGVATGAPLAAGVFTGAGVGAVGTLPTTTR